MCTHLAELVADANARELDGNARLKEVLGYGPAKAARGLTSLEEVVRVTAQDEKEAGAD